jgi:hypothetical protein
MSINTIEEIERAIVTLQPQELLELYSWLDQYQHPFDAHVQADFEAGRLDQMMHRALADERNGLTRAL